jgi:phosphoserine/homoserine phosphotransferase
VELACLDLEGVLIPEIWINFAERTGIDSLRATTRDIPDYDVLMKQRLAILKENSLGLPDIQEVIGGMSPLEGAGEFLDWLRARFQVIVLSDTFYEFAAPLMAQLGNPTLFCHNLEMDASGTIVDYHLRQADPKRRAVQALHVQRHDHARRGRCRHPVPAAAERDRRVPPVSRRHDLRRAGGRVPRGLGARPRLTRAAGFRAYTGGRRGGCCW